MSSGRPAFSPIRKHGLRPILIAALYMLSLLIYGFGDSRWQLVAVSTGAFLGSLQVLLWVGRLLPQQFGLRILNLSFAIQLLALAAIGALNLPLGPAFHPFEIDPAGTPFRAVIGLLIVPISTLVVAMAWRF